MRSVLAGLMLMMGTIFVLATSFDQPAAEQRLMPWSGQLPSCEDPSVLNQISSAFASRETKFWDSSLAISAYGQPELLALRPWGSEFIPRRYCAAPVVLSDGTKTRVDYSVREELGFAGYSWGVDFCVAGLDRHFAKEPGCRMARP